MKNLKRIYRHYFARRKSPVSYIFWREILKRDSSFAGSITDEGTGLYINLEPTVRGSYLDFTVWRDDGSVHKSITVPLGYRDAKRISDAVGDVWKAQGEAYDLDNPKLTKEDK